MKKLEIPENAKWFIFYDSVEGKTKGGFWNKDGKPMFVAIPWFSNVSYQDWLETMQRNGEQDARKESGE